jgi:hypothetical protein
MQNIDHNFGFREKSKFFRQKLSKIAENCDHNIDPWNQTNLLTIDGLKFLLILLEKYLCDLK